jgi:hypothetical protein
LKEIMSKYFVRVQEKLKVFFDPQTSVSLLWWLAIFVVAVAVGTCWALFDKRVFGVLH